MIDAPAQATLTWKPIADLNELRDLGILHEINRLLLHPVGLALCLRLEEGVDSALFLYDGRDDPDGITFADDALDSDKAQAFALLMKEGVERRLPALGYGIQPVDSPVQVLLSLRDTFEGHGPNVEDAETDGVAGGHWDARSGH